MFIFCEARLAKHIVTHINTIYSPQIPVEQAGCSLRVVLIDVVYQMHIYESSLSHHRPVIWEITFSQQEFKQGEKLHKTLLSLKKDDVHKRIISIENRSLWVAESQKLLYIKRHYITQKPKNTSTYNRLLGFIKD